MYDWIPMEFDFDIAIHLQNTEYAKYHCIANSVERESFKVLYEDGKVCLNTYLRKALIDAMEDGSLINGMTMDELKDSYYIGNEEATIDIGELI